MNLKSGKSEVAPVALNPQAMVNCVTASSCNGGSANLVNEYAVTHGIPHASCLQYVAENDACNDLDMCRDCVPPIPNEGEDLTSNCTAIKNDTWYYASDAYPVSGVNDMKAEIYAHGPISCGINATEQMIFHVEKGLDEEGIYSEESFEPFINHFISVVGWGTSEKGRDFWVVRNDWGSYWGIESGFFKIDMHKDNLSINYWCAAAQPSYTKAKQEFVTE